MARLRKMLGCVDGPEAHALMELINTQRLTTLAEWAATCAQDRYRSLVHNANLGLALDDLVEVARTWAVGDDTLRHLKAAVRDVRRQVREADVGHVERAAAGAIMTAANVGASPAASLGFVWYGAAAAAYGRLGLDAAPADLDEAAREELAALLASLRAAAVPDEDDPVAIDWHC